MPSLLSCENISFAYGERTIFSQLSFQIQPQEFWVVSGDSGVGKSTLLKVLSGELKATSGAVQKPAVWSEIPQSLGLCSGLTAHEAIATGALRDLRWWQSIFSLPAAALQKARELAQVLKIDHVIQHDISKLSGGEKQRVAMARSLMGSAQLFMVDEPISMLDENRALEALLILKNEVFSRGGSLICVLHQSQMIKEFATHQLVLTQDQGWKIL